MIAVRYKGSTSRRPGMEKTVNKIKCVCQVVLHNFTKELGTTSGKGLVLNTSSHLHISYNVIGTLGIKLESPLAKP